MTYHKKTGTSTGNRYTRGTNLKTIFSGLPSTLEFVAMLLTVVFFSKAWKGCFRKIKVSRREDFLLTKGDLPHLTFNTNSPFCWFDSPGVSSVFGDIRRFTSFFSQSTVANSTLN